MHVGKRVRLNVERTIQKIKPYFECVQAIFKNALVTIMVFLLYIQMYLWVLLTDSSHHSAWNTKQ